VGHDPDRLTLREQIELTGKWIALEIYTPENLAERRIIAVGDSASECIRNLASRGFDPRHYEFRPYKRPR
jgi:hypothetical protein